MKIKKVVRGAVVAGLSAPMLATPIVSLAQLTTETEVAQEVPVTESPTDSPAAPNEASDRGGASPEAATDASAPPQEDVLQEITVTAQRRAQSLQDVPIAITALSADALEVNRVATVADLGAVVPNLTLREVAGGIGAVSFSMRGSVSFGTVPGQDKAVGMYLDGVYLGAAFGTVFDLPNIQRLEVLRGPQGTLFGRNATAGAISVVTRDPKGVFGGSQMITRGNYDQFRSATLIDLPAWHDFSASLAYTRDERTGDMKNTGAGEVWDFSGGSGKNQGRGISPKTLGDKDQESVFVATAYEPNDALKLVYKYDWMENHYTPEGTALVADFGFFGPVDVVESAKRPKSVNNLASTPGYQTMQGHNLTVNYRIREDLSLKSVLGYRKSLLSAHTDIGGGGFETDDGPFIRAAATASASHKQWSEEVQLVYTSDLVTLTGGALYYDGESFNGAPDGLAGPQYFTVIPGGAWPSGQRVFSRNDATSTALFAQSEWHVTKELDLVAGYRLTRDKKSGNAFNFFQGEQLEFDFDYKDTRSSYLAGVNYKLTDDMLLYGKYSTGFVSGGSVAGIDFPAETVKAWEGGLKSSFFERKLRANLALFKADYKDLQVVTAGFGLTPSRPDINTVILPEGDMDTYGAELELTYLALRGLTLSASGGYTHSDFSNVNPIVRPADSHATTRPKFTSILGVSYVTQPLVGDASLSLNLSGNYKSKQYLLYQTEETLPPEYKNIGSQDGFWMLNGRMALQEIRISESVSAEFAIWGKNLTDVREPTFVIDFQAMASSTFERARTYGADVIIRF